MRNRSLFNVFAALSTAALLSGIFVGCGLLPEEEAAPAPPVIHAYEKVEYKLAPVERGDVIERERTTFFYTPQRQESMGFKIDGAALKGVYVTTGEEVEEGELLAELDDGGLADMIVMQAEQVASLESCLRTLERDHARELRACDIRITADPENERLRENRASTIERYNEDKQAVTLRLDAARAKLGEYEESLGQHKLYAPFSGTVTFIKSFGIDSYRSTASEVFVTISDKTSLTFTAEGEDACRLFDVGDKVELNMDGIAYPSTIIAEEEQIVTLEPEERIVGVDEGSYGNVWVVVNGRYDVLRVPTSAVASANGYAVVYVLKDGARALREVETGLTADGFTEIISGIAEGEQVVTK